ncbi:MAG: hypothetical protein WDZ41_05685 [Candidatus Babeliales bacterium]
MKFKFRYLSLLSIFFVCVPSSLLGFKYFIKNETGQNGVSVLIKVKRGLFRKKKNFGPVLLNRGEKRFIKGDNHCLYAVYARITSKPYATDENTRKKPPTRFPVTGCGDMDVTVTLGRDKKAKISIENLE